MTKKKTKKKLAKRKAAPKRKELITVELEMAGKKYTSKANTLIDAVIGLGSQLTYLDVKTKGVVRIKRGDLVIEKLFPLQALRRLMASKFARIGYAKQMEHFLVANKSVYVST